MTAKEFHQEPSLPFLVVVGGKGLHSLLPSLFGGWSQEGPSPSPPPKGNRTKGIRHKKGGKKRGGKRRRRRRRRKAPINFRVVFATFCSLSFLSVFSVCPLSFGE